LQIRARILDDAVGGFARILTAIAERRGVGVRYDPGEIDLDVDRLIAKLGSALR
jgi:hypothetical protein